MTALQDRSSLVTPLSALEHHYPVVIVGSGYGGAICASRLARAGQRVCVLERGREHRPGDFPRTLAEARREVQLDTPQGHAGRRTALYDFRVGRDLHALVGCGVGGTSLINANVAVRPDPRVLASPHFPRAFRDELGSALDEGYGRAEEMLGVARYPVTGAGLPKLRALHRSASRLGLPSERLPVAVSFADQRNRAGEHQPTCILCGDCVTGCNTGAKGSVDRNYLPDAVAHGARIFAGIAVRSLSRSGGHWRLHLQLGDAGREQFSTAELSITADLVILAAGALGSSEVLLRSRQRGLPLSSRLGQQFSGNGDVLAFSYNGDQPVRGVGFGAVDPRRAAPVGPCITGWIDGRGDRPVQDAWVIEDGSLPGPIAELLPGLFQVAGALIGRDTDRGVGDRLGELWRMVQSSARGPRAGAMAHTQTFLVMAHDGAAGVLELGDDRLRITWPGVAEQPIFARIQDVLTEASRALGGTFEPNPIWPQHLGGRLITVHPLGGCAMGESAETGVVDHKGRVFSGDSGTGVHAGLYVCDGAVLPTSIGVNPFLTISAIGERMVAHLARDRGWILDNASRRRRHGDRPRRPGLRFTERMSGRFEPLAGAGGWSPLAFVVTIETPDLGAMLHTPEHEAGITGTVEAPGLDPEPLTVLGGHFRLLYRDPDRPAERRMRYSMVLRASGGTCYFLDGLKYLADEPGVDIWSDSTTLHYRVHGGESADGPLLGTGRLTIGTADLLAQLRTLEVTGAPTAREAHHHLLQFLRFFSCSLLEVYRAGGRAPSGPRRSREALPRRD